MRNISLGVLGSAIGVGGGLLNDLLYAGAAATTIFTAAETLIDFAYGGFAFLFGYFPFDL